MGAGYPSQRMLYFSLEDSNFFRMGLCIPLHALAGKPAIVGCGVCLFLPSRMVVISPSQDVPKGRLELIIFNELS